MSRIYVSGQDTGCLLCTNLRKGYSYVRRMLQGGLGSLGAGQTSHVRVRYRCLLDGHNGSVHSALVLEASEEQLAVKPLQPRGVRSFLGRR